ncbi:MAG: hypothetical protein P4L55_06015 [Syntrophobacteraceae bacterium]|nr:hypothetical protein [Syntrophobacteraceae bacterium]
MTEQAMPNVAGKGPTLIREMLGTFKEVEGSLNGLSSPAAEKIRVLCTEQGREIEPLTSRAYMKTVKAGETAWQCGQMALRLKESIAAGNEAAALETVDKLGAELGGLINKTKNFVVRMT